MRTDLADAPARAQVKDAAPAQKAQERYAVDHYSGRARFAGVVMTLSPQTGDGSLWLAAENTTGSAADSRAGGKTMAGPLRPGFAPDRNIISITQSRARLSRIGHALGHALR